jgi:hypothetical protein
MTEHCCITMDVLCRDRSEQLARRDDFLRKIGEDSADLPDVPEPVVSFRSDLGLYVIDNVALHFCPWCGTDLKPLRVGPTKNL